MKKTTAIDIKECVIANTKYLMWKNRMKQKELATISGSSQKCVSNWCTGVSFPTMSNIVSICKRFNITIDDFVLTKLENGTRANPKIKAKSAPILLPVDFGPLLPKTPHSEILDFLIGERKFLHTVKPFRINSIIITKLEEALMWPNKSNAEANDPVPPDKHHYSPVK